MSEVRITVNGQPRATAAGTSVAGLIVELGMDAARDAIEIVAFVGGGSGDDPLVIAGRTFHSRLLIGTGKYKSIDETRRAIALSGAEIVTVALRRVDLTPGAATVIDAVDRARHTLLPNTAGCYTAEEAIRTCRLARELGVA